MLKLLKKFFGVKTKKTETNNNILSENDIYKLTDTDFEEDLVDNALKEAEKMLEDCLKTKKDLEDKAGKLLTAQFSLIAIPIAIMNMKIFELPIYITQIIWWPILCLTIGLIASVFCLQVIGYGSCGVDPNFFLEKETFTTKKEKFKSLKAYILVDYAKRIDVSIKSNEKKASYLKTAINCMISFLIPFLLIGLGVGLWLENHHYVLILSVLISICLFFRTKIFK
jgi:hypothetical protein